MAEIVRLLINGELREVEVLSRKRSALRFKISGREYEVEFPEALPLQSKSQRPLQKAAPARARGVLTAGGEIGILAPIPGVIIDVLIAEGTVVEAGALLCRLEAMKMQNSIFSPERARVKRVLIAPGQEVSDGELLFEMAPEGTAS